MNRWLAGATAGCAATVPMTVLMEIWFRQLPPEEQYTLPPGEITMEAAEVAGVDKHLDTEGERTLATLAAHFGYGTLAGVVYNTLAERVPLPPVVKGAAFGLGVWTVSYLGLMPGLGLLSSATKHPAERNLLMITANVVWGSVTAVLVEQLQSETQASHDAA